MCFSWIVTCCYYYGKKKSGGGEREYSGQRGWGERGVNSWEKGGLREAMGVLSNNEYADNFGGRGRGCVLFCLCLVVFRVTSFLHYEIKISFS